VAAVNRTAFDAILIDLEMPVMSGFEAVAAIRAGELATGMRVPILAMTAHAMPGDRERCRASGMDGYISKPIALQTVREALADAVSPKALAC
jgi:CheY-like chemotaxis protein